MILAPDLCEIDGGLGVFQLHPLHGVEDDPGHGKVAERLGVARNGEPGRVLGRGALQRLVEGGEVVVEVGALLVVGIADLPLPVRVVEPLGKAPQLLLLRDDQAELEDRGAVLLVSSRSQSLISW